MKRAILLLSVGMGVTGCNPFEPKIYSICEEMIKDRLRSPSMYARHSASLYESALTYDKWMLTEDKKLKHSETAKRLVRSGDYITKKITLVIRYDAPNAYGTPIRGAAMCEHVSDDGKQLQVSRYNVKLDGQTAVEWLTGVDNKK